MVNGEATLPEEPDGLLALDVALAPTLSIERVEPRVGLGELAGRDGPAVASARAEGRLLLLLLLLRRERSLPERALRALRL